MSKEKCDTYVHLYPLLFCVTLGAVISWRGLPPRVLRGSDMVMNTALMLLMTVIGLNIGLSETVMKNLGRIGIKCLLISLAAIACSVALTVLCERTVMPLEKIRLALLREKQETAWQNRDAGRGALPRAENAERKQEDATGECGDTKGGIAQQASLLPENAQRQRRRRGRQLFTALDFDAAVYSAWYSDRVFCAAQRGYSVAGYAADGVLVLSLHRCRHHFRYE